MARRVTRVAVPPVEGEHVYPFTRDETHKGRMARIPGRTGQFRVHAHETNPRTGASWWQLIGPVTAGDPGQWVHVREINLVPVPRAKKGV